MVSPFVTVFDPVSADKPIEIGVELVLKSAKVISLTTFVNIPVMLIKTKTLVEPGILKLQNLNSLLPL